MRFLGRYELLEQLTVGKVETFASYPVGGGERLLIHVFALPALIKSAPTNRDLLGYMEAISPPALGTVLDAGRYDDGSQAYVVTKFPRDLSAVNKWVEAYKALAREKHDTTTEVNAGALWEQEQRIKTKQIPTVEKPAGDFTRAFQAFGPTDGAGEPKSENDQFRDPPAVESRPTQEFQVERSETSSPPGSLTEQFMAGLGEGTRLVGAPQSTTAPARLETTFPSASSSPPVDSWAGKNHSNREDESAGIDGRPGEFTTFFKSPLAPQPTSPGPLMEGERYCSTTSGPSRGEFTQLFGAETTAGPNNPIETGSSLEPVSQGDGFTSIFGKAASQPSERDPVSPLGQQSSDFEPAAEYVVSPKINPTPTALARPATEPALGGNGSLGTLPGQNRDENATRLFRPPVQDPPPQRPSAPAPGESEYTRIISPKAKPTANVDKSTTQPAHGGGGIQIPIQVSPPAIPSVQVPHLPSPHLPPPLPSPSVHVPTIPSVAIPKMPSPPVLATKAGKKPRGWTAYAPLIVILNLLLLAAVGLVLYFIFQH